MNRLNVRARYGFAGGVLVSLMVMAATGAGRAANNEVATWQPGKFDDRAIECLRESTQILKLRTTTLKEIAPAYFVAGPENVSWEEAVARANREFGNDGDRRALFLRKFLPDGSPVERIAELKLPDMGFSVGTGSGHSKTYGLGVTWEEEPMPNARDAKAKKPGFVAKVRTPKAKATLSFWVSPGGKTLGAPLLSVKDIEVKDIRYGELDFDPQDKLEGFTRRVAMPKTAFEVEVGGNTSGEQGTDFFYAVVSENGARREQINFTPRLVLAERSVYELGTAKTTYMEVYENGKLRRRRHYGERKTDGGTQSFVERTEEFK